MGVGWFLVSNVKIKSEVDGSNHQRYLVGFRTQTGYIAHGDIKVKIITIQWWILGEWGCFDSKDRKANSAQFLPNLTAFTVKNVLIKPFFGSLIPCIISEKSNEKLLTEIEKKYFWAQFHSICSNFG